MPGVAVYVSIVSCAEWWVLIRRMFFLINMEKFFPLSNPGFSWLGYVRSQLHLSLSSEDLAHEMIYTIEAKK